MLFFVNAKAQTDGEGGGIYLKSGGQLIGTVVHSNKAEDGYGVAGGDVRIINSTVCSNLSVGNLMDGIKAGDIYCADGKIRSREAYTLSGEKNAIGVVFWVNSNYYAAYPKGYVVALEGTTKSWTGSVLASSDPPLNDTACYGKTALLVSAGNEAALYCAGYTVAGESPGRWCMPAVRHLSRLYTNQAVVDATLEFLEQGGTTAMSLSPDFYWSVTPDGSAQKHVILINFKEINNTDMPTSGEFVLIDPLITQTAHTVRPIFVY